MFYNRYKLSWSNLQSVFSSLSEHTAVRMIRTNVYILNTIAPKVFPRVFLQAEWFQDCTFFLVQPITYTVSLCLATVSNHRINSLNGINQSQAAHKWASQSHQLTPTLTLTYQPYEEKITSDVIDIDLLCVLIGAPEQKWANNRCQKNWGSDTKITIFEVWFNAALWNVT